MLLFHNEYDIQSPPMSCLPVLDSSSNEKFIQ